MDNKYDRDSASLEISEMLKKTKKTSYYTSIIPVNIFKKKSIPLERLERN